MKNILFITSIFILLNSNSYSQSGWYWQNPLPQGNDLVSVKFLNSKTGFTVGHYGIILKTTDGGNNWRQLNSPINDLFYSIHIFNDSSIIIGGSKFFYKSSNDGNSWTSHVVSNSTNNIAWLSITFLNESTGFAGGRVYTMYNTSGTIVKTTNGGNNWFTAKSTSYAVKSASFIDQNTGYFSSNYASNYPYDVSQILKTTDCGATWITSPVFVRNVFFSIKAFNKDSVYVLEYNGKIFKTSNGGLNWNPFIIDTVNKFYSFNFLDYENGLIVSDPGKILKTTNGGMNFSYINTNSNENLNDVAYVDSINSVAIGNSGEILHSSDNNEHWESKLKGYKNEINSIFFRDENSGFAACNNLIIRTTNAGSKWDSVFSNSTKNFNSVFFLKNGIGFSVGDSGIIYKTINNGTDWILKSSGVTSNLNSIYFLDNFNGFIAGNQNAGGYVTFLKTSDGGESWNNVSVLGNLNLHSTFFISPQHGAASGSNGNIMVTTNGGISWSFQHIGEQNEKLFKIIFLNSFLGYCVGERGYVYKTINGGTSWITVNLQYGWGPLQDINFINQNVGFILGKQIYNNITRIYKTTDSGNSWYLMQSYNINENIKLINFLNQNTGYLCGTSGTILKTTNGGGNLVEIKQSNNYLPSQFLLQNYPNPFNPTTKIKYEISQLSFVKLNIYDNLGRKVDELVNEYRTAGLYETDWNANNFPSGIYFYKIETENFTVTKKMILIK
ncbi:MAG: YCF48-related protein [Bacteroidota bacterium]|nr:YCF48-related protein [Bacteroidota bacterium]